MDIIHRPRCRSSGETNCSEHTLQKQAPEACRRGLECLRQKLSKLSSRLSLLDGGSLSCWGSADLTSAAAAGLASDHRSAPETWLSNQGSAGGKGKSIIKLVFGGP